MSDLKRFTMLCEKIDKALATEDELIEKGIDVKVLAETYHECIIHCLELGFSDKAQRENLAEFLYNQQVEKEIVDGDNTFIITSPKDMWEYILNSEA